MATLTEPPPVDVRDDESAPTPRLGGGPDDAIGTSPPARARLFKPGWPLAAIFVPFPLWWVLGLSEFACILFAIPMALDLARQQRISVPHRFGFWLFFLVWVVGGVFVLNVDAVGAVADTSSTRYLTWAYRLSWYVAITIVGVYVLNRRDVLTPARVARAVSMLFLTVVAGGVLGILAPTLEFSSLLELALPDRVTEITFVQRMMHPQSAQLMEVLGYASPRPSAPFAYANIWGLNFAATLPFFLYAWWGPEAAWRRYLAPVILLVAALPAVYSINRGMWAALIVVALFVAGRAALAGRPALMGGVIAGVAAIAAVVSLSSLGTIVSTRLTSEGSEQGRTNLATLTVTSAMQTSPVAGLGSTRNVQGNFNTITAGATPDCPRCSPPALGTQGQLWLVLFSQGLVGLVLYLGFFGLTFVRSLRLRSPVALTCMAVLIVGFVTMPVYNSIGVALMVIMIAVALLNRESSTHHPPSLSQYTDPLRRHSVLIALCTLAGLGAGAAWQYHRGAIYTATQTVLLPKPPRFPSGGDGPMNLDTEAQLLASPGVAGAVRSATGVPLPPDSDDLRVVAIPNSRVFRLSYEGASPRIATAGVQAASAAFLEERGKRLDAERDAEVAYLVQRAKSLDSQVRILNDSLEAVTGSGVRVPLAATRNARETRWNLLTQIQKTNYQLTRVVGNPARVGQPTLPTTVAAKTDGWNIALTSGGLLGLLAGATTGYGLARRTRRLRSPGDLGASTGMPLLGVLPRDPGGLAVVRAATVRMEGRRHRDAEGTPVSREHVVLSLAVHGVSDLVALGDSRRAGRAAAELRRALADARSIPLVRHPASATGASSPAGEVALRHPRVALVVQRGTPAGDVVAARDSLRRVGQDVLGAVWCP